MKLKIAVLMGGPSSEREISFKSGRAVFDALKRRGYEAAAIDAVDEWEDRLKEFSPEAAFIALHGKFGEDGTAQSILGGMNMPYTGSGVTASRLAMDKIASRQFFKDAGLTVPESAVISKPSFINEAVFAFPVVVKPSSQGSSIGLSIVDSKEGLKKALDLAFVFDDNVIIEKFITGREITAAVLGEDTLPVIQIAPKRRFYDYKAKYVDGQTEYLAPAPIGKEYYAAAQQAVLKAHKALGCRDFSRADMILGDDGVIRVLEVNSIPGFTYSSLLPKAAACAGIGFDELCERIVKMAIRRGRHKS